MKRLILASNLLPVNIQWENGKYQIEKEVETTISGLQNFYSEFETEWVGLTPFENHDFNTNEVRSLETALKPHHCIPVFPRQRYRSFLMGQIFYWWFRCQLVFSDIAVFLPRKRTDQRWTCSNRQSSFRLNRALNKCRCNFCSPRASFWLRVRNLLADRTRPECNL